MKKINEYIKRRRHKTLRKVRTEATTEKKVMQKMRLAEVWRRRQEVGAAPNGSEVENKLPTLRT